MAIRTNCVEYVGTNRTSTLAASTTEEQTFTVDIPENSSRTFLSVFMEVYCDDNNAATSSRGSMTARTLGVGIDAVADDDATITDTITDSGDQASFVFKRDITSYFTTNYTGTSHTVGLRFSYTQSGANALTVNNVSMRLVVTYSYDDTSQTTRIKTVRIPLQSKLGSCGTSEEEIYSNGTTSSSGTTSQIPDLSSFLPEASKTYKDIFFDIEWNDAYSGTTDQVVSLKTASDATYNPGTYEKANNTLVYHHLFWKRTDLATNAVQAFKMWATSANHNCPRVLLCVTYTYDHSSSTTLLASVVVALTNIQAKYPSASSSEPGIVPNEIWVPEPGTITLKHSAVAVYPGILGLAPSAFSLRCGAGSYASYVLGATGGAGGQPALLHRIDSGGLGGMTLQRGRNALNLGFYFGDSVLVKLNAFAILNYSHDKPGAGSGVATHTIRRLSSGDAADVNSAVVASQAETVPESSFFISSYFLHVSGCVASTNRESIVEVLRTSGDTPNEGSETAFFGSIQSAIEVGIGGSVGAGTWYPWQRFAADPNARRLDIERSRSWRVSNLTDVPNNFMIDTWLTYHAITFSKTSTVSGSAGGTVNWRLCYNGSASLLFAAGERVASGSRSGDGTVALTWYDDTESMYLEAYDDATGRRVGRSGNFTFA